MWYLESGFFCFLGTGNYSQRSMGFLGSLYVHCGIVDNHKGPWLAQGRYIFIRFIRLLHKFLSLPNKTMPPPSPKTIDHLAQTSFTNLATHLSFTTPLGPTNGEPLLKYIFSVRRVSREFLFTPFLWVRGGQSGRSNFVNLKDKEL